jgi:hypothetical protein
METSIDLSTISSFGNGESLQIKTKIVNANINVWVLYAKQTAETLAELCL